MAKKNKTTHRRDAREDVAAGDAQAPHGHQFVVFRETLESIVVAFVLAFLFRNFEAEAFVIPTGSMSPSLLGQHKDVECPECGFSYRTTASSEGEEGPPLASRQVVGGMCPMCRYLAPLRPDLPPAVLAEAGVTREEVEFQPTYSGDRVLVNKYGGDFGDPERWDVIVFKFPGDGNMNYIKRLVGLPGEVIRVYLGDLFTKPLGASDDEFRIERKPPSKAGAMLERVHDTDFEPAALYRAGWPMRWAATTADGWKVVAEPQEETVDVRFEADLPTDGPTAWLRYRHLTPGVDDWLIARIVEKTGSFDEAARLSGMTQQEWVKSAHPHLIRDFNAYNARVLRGHAEQPGIGWQIPSGSGHMGTEWVGDLALDCVVSVAEARGELMLDLVEAGYHFRATFDLKTGQVALRIVDGRTGETVEGFRATAKTTLNEPGEYGLRFANIDDQLMLWVDGDLVDLGDAAYDPDKLLGGRDSMIPWASEEDDGDQGDLAPVGVAARGAKLTVTRLAVLRDIYYIAAKYPGDELHLLDYVPPYEGFQWQGTQYPPLNDGEELFALKEAWPRFATRVARDFDVKQGQLFVLGDNSPESKDCRLWMEGNAQTGIPGGQYLDRRLLIGKAVAVFWPHSWGNIPGLPILPGWPNFSDMRMVR